MANEYNSNFNYNDPIGSYNVLSSTSTVTIDKLIIDKLIIDNNIYDVDIKAKATITPNGVVINSFGGDVIVYAKYKISKFNKIEIDIKFNKIENNLTFDIINKETIKLILENK